MTKYKLTDKAIKEKFYMLSDLTLGWINIKINEAIEEAEKNGAQKPTYTLVSLSRIVVSFKNPEMNKLFNIVGLYKFQVYDTDIEEEEELEEITTGVWYDVEDVIDGKYNLSEALDELYDVLACEASADNLEWADNFTANHRSYHVGYLDEDGDGYVLVEKGHEHRLEHFARIMFIPAETPEEE